jgi:short subunit dehydrogenase-like uncharacterized protein
VFSLEYPDVVESRVGDVTAVLNCAGPFTATTDPLVSACLETGTDYLDIAGSIPVLEAIAERDHGAEQAGVSLVPGVGFDVVPTDCLAASLHNRLQSATRLTLALDGLDAGSPGTLKSVVEQLSRPGAVRADGEIREVPVAWKRRRFDFGRGPKTAVTVPWGDISTAYYTTGIPNIEAYATVPERAIRAMELARPLVPLLGSRPVRRALSAAIDRTVSGPTAQERAGNVARVWGAAETDDGERVVGRLETPDPYDLTALTAVAAATRTVEGEVEDGFQTPASAFGADFVAEIEGVEREFESAESADVPPADV